MRAFYTVHELAVRWQVSPKQIRKWIASEMLDASLLGVRLWRVRIESAHRFETKHLVAAVSETERTALVMRHERTQPP